MTKIDQASFITSFPRNPSSFAAHRDWRCKAFAHEFSRHKSQGRKAQRWIPMLIVYISSLVHNPCWLGISTPGNCPTWSLSTHGLPMKAKQAMIKSLGFVLWNRGQIICCITQRTLSRNAFWCQDKVRRDDWLRNSANPKNPIDSNRCQSNSKKGPRALVSCSFSWSAAHFRVASTLDKIKPLVGLFRGVSNDHPFAFHHLKCINHIDNH